MNDINRRTFLGAAAGATAAAARAQDPRGPKFSLSCNIELMFPKEMSLPRRLELIAAEGLKAYSLWGAREVDLLRQTADRLGLACGSMSGNGRTGWSGGLTKPGAEPAFLEEIAATAKLAQRLGCTNLISFVGQVQKDVPWDAQYRQIIEGLRRAGDIAEEHKVDVVLEPLNPIESPNMSVLSAKEGFKIIDEVNHPRVKLDFDLYHLQLGEGNLINNLKKGLARKWIRFVEVGDVPGRKEPGTGEVNYANIFAVLRDSGYDGFVGLEHRSSSTPEHAMRAVKRVAGLAN
jgi:hydroxypyruvate isomerase